MGDLQPIVLDNGSGVTKAGFAGADEPQAVFGAYVGTPKHKRVMAGAAEGERFVGRRAEELRGLLKVRHALEHGRVTDWGAQEALWAHAYAALRAQSEAHPLLLTEAPLGVRADRERAAETLFERFKIPALHVAAPAVLALYAAGRTTGLVLDVGDGVAQAVPVVEGFALQHALARADVAGRDVTAALALQLRRAGRLFATSAEREVVRAMKETVCFVAADPSAAEQRAAATASERGAQGSPWGRYTLPDGAVLDVGPERFRAPEVLFRPDALGDESPGVHDLAAGAIARADVELRPLLYANVLLAGGTTLLPGFGARLLGEIRAIAPRDTKIRIVAPPERALSAWIGGSLLASLAAFRRMWVSKAEFEESGVNIVHRRFF